MQGREHGQVAQHGSSVRPQVQSLVLQNINNNSKNNKVD
jgi:hypothetical protein